jgi:hypothetical protein
MSHSNSSTSLGEGVVSKESEQLPVMNSSPVNEEGALVKQMSKSDNGLVPQEKPDDELQLEKCGDPISDSNVDSIIKCKFDTEHEGSAHQRSRSNEIDYVSLRPEDRRRPRLHSFRTPSDSKPLDSSSRVVASPQPEPAQTDHMDSPPPGDDSLPNSADAILSAKDRESRSEPREGSGRESVPGDQFSLLKEFDSSVWSNSNYFTSLDNP